MYLTGVHLMDAHLIGVYLMSVYLTGVHLMGVYLINVHLTGVHIIGASHGYTAPAQLEQEVVTLGRRKTETRSPRGTSSVTNNSTAYGSVV